MKQFLIYSAVCVYIFLVKRKNDVKMCWFEWSSLHSIFRMHLIHISVYTVTLNTNKYLILFWIICLFQHFWSRLYNYIHESSVVLYNTWYVLKYIWVKVEERIITGLTSSYIPTISNQIQAQLHPTSSQFLTKFEMPPRFLPTTSFSFEIPR